MSIVMKFGGTSVADAAALENVARIVAAQRPASPVVVVSAMSGVTDSLLAATTTAIESNANEAISSLEKTFQRHHAAAKELLSEGEAQKFVNEVNSAADRIAKNAKEAVSAFAEGDERQAMLMGAKRFTKYAAFNSKDARRLVAAKVIAAGKNPF